MAQKWSDEGIDAAIERAKAAYFATYPAASPTVQARWRAVVLAVLDELFEQDDYFDEHEDVRTFLVEDAEEVRWVGPYTVAIGEGPSACKANKSENPNWVLQHAANALMLYRVLSGDVPWPTDPKAAERERMAAVLRTLDASFTGPEALAEGLQKAGFTLPEQPAA